MHVEQTKYFNLTLCVNVGVDVHGNPHCVKTRGGSARPCCVGLTRAIRESPLPSRRTAFLCSLWHSAAGGLSRSLRWGAGGVRHIFLSRKRQFSAVWFLWGLRGLSFSKERPLQRSSSAFLFSVPLQRSPKAFPPRKKGTLSDPFCYAFLNRQRPGRS